MTGKKELFESMILARRKAQPPSAPVAKPTPIAKVVLDAIIEHTLKYIPSEDCPTADETGAAIFLALPGVKALIIHPDNVHELQALALACGFEAIDVRGIAFASTSTNFVHAVA